MLQAVEPVNVKVVRDEEEQELNGHRPTRHEVDSGKQMNAEKPADEPVDDQAQDIALENAVADEIHEEAGAKDLLPLVVRKDLLEPHEREGRPDDDDQRQNLPVHVASAYSFTRRSFFIDGISLSCTRLTPSPSDVSMSRTFWTNFAMPPGSTDAA